MFFKSPDQFDPLTVKGGGNKPGVRGFLAMHRKWEAGGHLHNQKLGGVGGRWDKKKPEQGGNPRKNRPVK